MEMPVSLPQEKMLEREQGKVKSLVAILSDGNCGLNFFITTIRECVTGFPYFSTQALRLWAKELK